MNAKMGVKSDNYGDRQQEKNGEHHDRHCVTSCVTVQEYRECDGCSQEQQGDPRQPRREHGK